MGKHCKMIRLDSFTVDETIPEAYVCRDYRAECFHHNLISNIINAPTTSTVHRRIIPRDSARLR